MFARKFLLQIWFFENIKRTHMRPFNIIITMLLFPEELQDLRLQEQ
jgi:hypothetical protein